MAGRTSRGVSGKTRNYQPAQSGEEARRSKSAGQRTSKNAQGMAWNKAYKSEKATSFETSRRYNGNHSGKPSEY
jgi:hypothetical protein